VIKKRLVSYTGAATAGFVYDGDGKRVSSTMKKYYSAGAQRIAVRHSNGGATG
jgi:hypothetical protein